jgi:Ca2+-binding RTX toxin-like protein
MAVSNETRLNGGEQLPQKQPRATSTEFTAALDAAKARAAPPRPTAGRPVSPNRDARNTGRDALAGREGLADEKLYGFRVHSGFGGVTIEGQEGDDTISVETAPAPAGRVRVRAKGGLIPYDLEPGDRRRLTIRGRGGNDKIKVSASLDRGVTIDGGAGNDVIDGGKGKDRLIGGSGNDRIEGGGGNDIIEGQAGNDVLHGQSGGDAIDGGRGRDYIDGGAGEDEIRGGKQNDVITGGRDDDEITGGRGDDVMLTSGGHDAVDDHSGVNTVYTENGEEVDINGRSSQVAMTAAAKIVGVSAMIYGDDRFHKSTKSDLGAVNDIAGLSSADASGHGSSIMPPDKPRG